MLEAIEGPKKNNYEVAADFPNHLRKHPKSPSVSNRARASPRRCQSPLKAANRDFSSPAPKRERIASLPEQREPTRNNVRPKTPTTPTQIPYSVSSKIPSTPPTPSTVKIARKIPLDENEQPRIPVPMNTPSKPANQIASKPQAEFSKLEAFHFRWLGIRLPRWDLHDLLTCPY